MFDLPFSCPCEKEINVVIIQIVLHSLKSTQNKVSAFNLCLAFIPHMMSMPVNFTNVISNSITERLRQ